MRMLIGIAIAVIVLLPIAADAQPTSLETRVSKLEGRLNDTTSGALVFLFGAFCALWAQNTNRNPWAWFFIGALFNVIAVLIVLGRNANDRATATPRTVR